MEPLKPDVKKAILDANPQAQPSDIEEYEQLLAERYLFDPDMPSEPLNAPAGAPGGGAPAGAEAGVHERSMPASAASALEERLSELHARLFPAAAQGLRDVLSLKPAPAVDLSPHRR